MTIIRFFSDPHVGKELKANTTPKSRATLAQQLHLHAMQAARMPHPQGKRVDGTICGGDLFDTDSNPEHVLIAGHQVASQCDVVLGGNHDVVNIAGRESTLSALSKLSVSNDKFVMPPNPGCTSARVIPFNGVDVYAIPHHARQQEFEEVLEQAKAMAEECQEGPRARILLVHCNYHLTFEAGENDLNLTDAKARHLLQAFDYIVMGHDHRPRLECEGRLIVLGNTHPTSFSDQGEKRVWFYCSETNDWTYQVNAEEQRLEVQANSLISAWQNDLLAEYAQAEWIDVVGVLPPEATVDLAKAIAALWKVSPYIYAIRASRVQIRAEGQTDDMPAAAQKTLIEIIEEQLASSPDLLSLFREARDLKE